MGTGFTQMGSVKSQSVIDCGSPLPPSRTSANKAIKKPLDQDSPGRKRGGVFSTDGDPIHTDSELRAVSWMQPRNVRSFSVRSPA